MVMQMTWLGSMEINNNGTYLLLLTFSDSVYETKPI